MAGAFGPERMKAIVITLLCCATALGCALILSNRLPQAAGSKSSGQHEHYKLVQFDERFPVGMAGFADKTMFRIETTSGRTWRLNKGSIPSRLKTLDGKEAEPVTVEGWEEIPQSFSDALRKAWAKFGPTPVAPGRGVDLNAQPTASPIP